MSGQAPPPRPESSEPGSSGPGPEQPPPYPGPAQPPPYPGPAQPPPYPGPEQRPPYPGPAQPPPYPGPAQPPPYPGAPPPFPGQAPPGPPYGYHPYYSARPPKPRPDSTARLIGWILAAGAVVVVVAAFLPWFTAATGPDPQSFRGVGAEDVAGTNLEGEVLIGYITIFLAVVALGFAITRGCGALPLTAAIIGVVMGALILLLGLAGLGADDPVTFTDKATDVELPDSGTSEDWDVGIGLWLTIAGGLAMVVASIVGLAKRR